MATVGGVSCTFIRGDAPALTPRAEIWQVPGYNGYGVHLLGTGDARFRFVLVKHDTSPNVGAWYANIQALKGTVIAVTNDWGASYSNLYLAEVGPLRRIAAGINVARGEIAIGGVRLA